MCMGRQKTPRTPKQEVARLKHKRDFSGREEDIDAYRKASAKTYGFRKITRKGSGVSTVTLNDPWGTTYQQPS